jgi:apolipoprotein N-acyltransferase
MTIPERRAFRRVVAGLALLGGTGLFLGYANPFFQLPPLALFFPACLALFARVMPTAKGSFLAGWLCATLANSACLYWLSIPMHDFGGLPWPLTLPCVAALGGYLGLYGALFSLIYRLFRERLPFAAALPLVLPLWTALETAKGTLFSGFPWVSLATAFLPWEGWVQAASFVGANALSGLFALAATAIAEAKPVRFGFSPVNPPRARRFFCFACALLPLLCVYAARFAPALPEGRAVTVGLVQGNVNQNQKWEPAYQAATLSRYLTLSGELMNPAPGHPHEPPDLLVWPETSLPFYLETNPVLGARIADFSLRHGVPLVFGAPGKDAREERSGYYNRLWLQTPGSEKHQSYDKTHLVPFGEYVPLNIPLPFIEYLMQGLEFIPGESRAPLVAGDLALGALICYEAIFPELAQERVAQGANILVNASNDAWFGRSAAPVQHLQLTAMRAIEQGRYILRATNTGISAVISPRGAITAHGSLFRAEALVGKARLVSGTTVYHRTAPFTTWGSALLALLGLGCCRARRPGENTRSPATDKKIEKE